MNNHLTRFDSRFNLPASPSGEAPIFVLGSGWRCGSTLLQRLLCTSGEALIWGEPYGRAGIIPAMTRASVTLREQWPTEMHFPEPSQEDLTGGWIANMYPPPQALRDAFRAQLDTLLAAPAHARGYKRWGLKEVRLQAMDARMLSWVYPDARFVFLVRDPWDCWASAKGLGFYNTWPNQRVETVDVFARHWAKLTRSFLQWPTDSAMLVRYEDLIQPGFELSQIAEHCGLDHIDPAPLQKKIRGFRKPPTALDSREVEVVREASGVVLGMLGYSRARETQVSLALG